MGGNESALWRSRRAGRDSRPPRDSRPLRGGAARARRMADRKNALQSDSLASLVSRDRAADVPAAVGGADEVQQVAAAQFLLVRMGRATARRGCMDPTGGEGPAKPHRSPLSGLHFEGAQLGPATAIAAGTGLRTPLAWSGRPAPRFTCSMALIVALSNNCVVALRLGRRQARTSSQLPPADRRLAVYGAGT